MRPGFARVCARVATPLLLAILTAGTAFAQETPKPAPAEAVAYCLGCHEDKNLSLTLKDGSTMSLFVDPADLGKSVHAKQLICTDCHAKYDQDHPNGATFPSRRAYTVASYELCKKCHFDTYTRTLDVHVSWLRKAIEIDSNNPRFLKTIRGVGYRLDV